MPLIFTYVNEFQPIRRAKDVKKMIRPIRIAKGVFSRVRKMIRPIRSYSGVSFAPKFPPFLALTACSALAK